MTMSQSVGNDARNAIVKEKGLHLDLIMIPKKLWTVCSD